MCKLHDSMVWGIYAGLGTVLGALFIFAKKDWNSQSLAFYLGLAAGVMTAVVVFDILPSAFLYESYIKVFSGALSGVLLMIAGDLIISNKSSPPRTLSKLGYLIMLGIAMHDLPEGMAIALGEEMKSRTGMVIALGIGIHNIPEGMAIAAPLIMAGVKKLRVFMQILAVALITPLGTILGKSLIYELPSLIPLLLGMASGIMLYLVLFQLWPQAKQKDLQSGRWGFYLGIVIILAATFV